MRRLALAVCFIGMVAGSAAAQVAPAAPTVCVALDETRDTLPPEDRRAALIAFQQAFAKAGLQVVEGGCGATYTFYHVKLGSAVTVYIVGPQGTQQARAAKIDELPLTYEQVASAIATGRPLGSDQNTDRTNVTTDQMAPRRIGADNLKFITLGYGIVGGTGAPNGPAFGYGWRFELDRLALEISGNFVFASSNDSSGNGHGGISGNLIKLAGYYYQNPLSNASLFYGVGLGYGVTFLCDSSLMTTSCYGGGGLAATPAIGYEMLRSSTIRLMFQFTADLPIYSASVSFTDATGNTVTDRKWVPTFGLSVGIGVGKSNTIRVVSN